MADKPASDCFSVVIPGEMRGKGRPRFARVGSFVRAYTDAATASTENWIKACAIEAGIRTPMDGALRVTVDITTPIPRSWPQKRRVLAVLGEIWPTGRPDLDNCAKLICDALNGIAWRDDKQIVVLSVTKRYGATPQTLVLIDRIEEAA